MIKSLLLVGSAAPGSLEGWYRRAFERAGVERIEFFRTDLNGFAWCKGALVGRIASRLSNSLAVRQITRDFVRFIDRHAREYDCVIVVKGATINSRGIAEARELCQTAIWININPDDPLAKDCPGSTNRHVINAIKLFDVYCTWSETVAAHLRKFGAVRVLAVPFAHDEDAHRPMAVESQVDGSVMFFGTWDAEREAILESIAGDCRLCIFGHGWSRLRRNSRLRQAVAGRETHGVELREAVAKAVLCLNLLRDQNARSHNMRSFEIPALGGVMLTKRTAEQQQWFPHGIASLMYEDLTELRIIIPRVLRQSIDLAEIRRTAHRMVQEHTYTERARAILRQV